MFCRAETFARNKQTNTSYNEIKQLKSKPIAFDNVGSVF